MVHAAHASRTIVQLARVRAGIRDEIVERPERAVGAHEQDERRLGNHHHGDQVAEDVPRQHREEPRQHRVGRVNEPDRRAIRGGLRHVIERYPSAGASAVLDHDRLACLLGHLLRNEPRISVARAADRKRYDDASGPCLALRLGRRCGYKGRRHAAREHDARQMPRQGRKKIHHADHPHHSDTSGHEVTSKLSGTTTWKKPRIPRTERVI